MFAGNCAPGSEAGGVPGSAANIALAMRARIAGSNGASPGVVGVFTAAYL
jgi:hypothetical protein